jgi:GST-like protein
MTRASIRNLFGFYEAGEPVKFEEFLNVTRVMAAFVARPVVAKGLEIFKRG